MSLAASSPQNSHLNCREGQGLTQSVKSSPKMKQLQVWDLVATKNKKVLLSIMLFFFFGKFDFAISRGYKTYDNIA